jgi:Flp pilus assembly protein TadD
VARITRKELKTDKFALEVEQTVDFFEEHRTEILRYGGIAAVVALLIVGFFIYRGRQGGTREAQLGAAIEIQEAPVGGAAPGTPIVFATQAEKNQAATKAFTDLAARYPGTTEGIIARNYLGAILTDEGKLSEAETQFKTVADSGNKDLASNAKLSLADLYAVQGRQKDAEAVLRDLIAHPTVFVSKEQATFKLARLLAKSDPAEARKLIDPLRTSSDPGISQQAINFSAELAQQ